MAGRQLDPMMEMFPRETCRVMALTISVGSWVALYLVSQNLIILVSLPGPSFEILRLVSWARVLAYLPRPGLLAHLVWKLWSVHDADDPLLEARRVMRSTTAIMNVRLSYVVQIWVVVVGIRLLFASAESDLPSMHAQDAPPGEFQVGAALGVSKRELEFASAQAPLDETNLMLQALWWLLRPPTGSLDDAMWAHWKLVVANMALQSMVTSLMFCYLVNMADQERGIKLPQLDHNTTTRVLGPLPTEPALAENRECAICFQDYETKDSVRTLPCNHEFHVACIDPWLVEKRNACPLCNARVGKQKAN